MVPLSEVPVASTEQFSDIVLADSKSKVVPLSEVRAAGICRTFYVQ